VSNEAPTDALRLVPRRAVFDWLRDDVPLNVKMTIMPHHVDALMDRLSAAAPASPLPGGGDWGAIRNAFVRHADAFVKASRYEEASAIADKAAREIQDLMSPLSAASTGEPK